MIRKCEVCGRDYAAKRSTSRYCSSTCRSRAHRGYPCPPSSDPASPAPGALMTADEVVDVVGRAHESAADLSRASLLTPSPLCLSLSAAASKIEDALRSEGL
ncbi:hypothetical protein [Adlercreutzia shanghongiae]|uniref:Recombinase zinc beta ribbon domain-containing protein n=1 Tax=Adlercreutzia shanghongiae TaxID=3111773 RepID=A0ABU6IWG2_9ACTN|nr:hypothetical protein [Adlercreutzia sp. R22]MEC4294035.1 hypothetical protein [Adlercreutzia sp. R22]